MRWQAELLVPPSRLSYVVGIMTSIVRRPLQFHGIAFGIGDIYRWTLALGTEPQLDLPYVNAMGFEIWSNHFFVESVNAYAEVVNVPSFCAWCRASSPSQFSLNRHKVDQRPSGTELDQAKCVVPPLDGTAQHIPVKRDHVFEVSNSNYEVVYIAYRDHAFFRWVGGGGKQRHEFAAERTASRIALLLFFKTEPQSFAGGEVTAL